MGRDAVIGGLQTAPLCQLRSTRQTRYTVALAAPASGSNRKTARVSRPGLATASATAFAATHETSVASCCSIALHAWAAT